MAGNKSYNDGDFKFITKEEFLELIDDLPFDKIRAIEAKRRQKASTLKNSYDENVYRGISAEEWDEKVREGTSLDKLKQINASNIKKIDSRLDGYYLESVNQPKSSMDLTIVLLGKTGDGKSATGNTLLGSENFEHKMSSESVTRFTKERSAKWKYGNIKVVDTPGLQDTNLPKKTILREIARVVQICPGGIHAFLYTVNATRHRFTEEDREVLNDVKNQFGVDVMKYTILVMSHADGMGDFDLKSYVSGEKGKQGPYSKFLRELGWKVLALNNKARSKHERVENQERLLCSVVKMVNSNRQNPVYTNELFDVAQKNLQKKYRTQLEKIVAEELDQYIDDHPDVIFSSTIPQDLMDAVTSRLGDIDVTNHTVAVAIYEAIGQVRNVVMVLSGMLEGQGCTIL